MPHDADILDVFLQPLEVVTVLGRELSTFELHHEAGMFVGGETQFDVFDSVWRHQLVDAFSCLLARANPDSAAVEVAEHAGGMPTGNLAIGFEELSFDQDMGDRPNNERLAGRVLGNGDQLFDNIAGGGES